MYMVFPNYLPSPAVMRLLSEQQLGLIVLGIRADKLLAKQLY